MNYADGALSPSDVAYTIPLILLKEQCVVHGK